jgi:hypothetical protein
MVPDMMILSKHVSVPAICDLQRSRIDNTKDSSPLPDTVKGIIFFSFHKTSFGFGSAELGLFGYFFVLKTAYQQNAQHVESFGKSTKCLRIIASQNDIGVCVFVYTV